VAALCAQLLFLMEKLRAEVYSQLAPLSLAGFAGQLVAGLRGVLELAAAGLRNCLGGSVGCWS
jgi:hypothetical protein